VLNQVFESSPSLTTSMQAAAALYVPEVNRELISALT
jgi:hypothetical protein